MTLPSIEVRGGASCWITRGPGMEIVKSLQHLVFFFFTATDMVMGHIGVRLCHVVWPPTLSAILIHPCVRLRERTLNLKAANGDMCAEFSELFTETGSDERRFCLRHRKPTITLAHRRTHSREPQMATTTKYWGCAAMKSAEKRGHGSDNTFAPEIGLRRIQGVGVGASSGDSFGGEIFVRGKFRHTSNFGGEPSDTGNFDTPNSWFLVENQLCETLASEIDSLSNRPPS